MATASPGRAERLLETGLALAAELSLPALLQRIVDLAVELTDAQFGALGVLSEDGTHLVDFITSGISRQERELIGPLPQGRGILGALITDARPLRLRDIAADPRSVGFPAHHPPMHSFLGAPVRARGRVYGNVYLTNKIGAAEFSADDEASLVVLATQAGVAIANARLYEQVSRLSMLEDRERIARDLHDGVIQSLFAVGLSLQGTAAIVSDTRMAERIQQAVSEIDRVIGDLRSYIFGLRPSVLGSGGLTDALEQLAHEFQTRTGVTCVVEVDATLEQPLENRAQHIAHIVREALSNVERHAGAETCRLSVRRDAENALIEVDDDGSGFELAQPRRGMGLTNLEERSEEVGGRLELETAPGQGVVVRIRIPLEG